MFWTKRARIVAALIGVAQVAGLIWLLEQRETVVTLIAAGAVGVIAVGLLTFMPGEPRVAAVIGGGLAILTGAFLLLMALPTDPVIVVILGPPILGGIIALVNPGNRLALGGAILLIVGGAYLILIAGTGLLYVPAVIALVYAVLNREPGSRTVAR